ncbi:hypothetical protein SAMN05444858_110167 [Micromonospora avicenniae]|uniref:Uncharacterized protein n=1 Tax=Micromonospora avicenniae TaxID=1198245 RepID=A0A1N7B814_9ACTN|nr:hypothetical protein SAMN05444858_110167 [Micromonospora avicenniae]
MLYAMRPSGSAVADSVEQGRDAPSGHPELATIRHLG